MLTRDMVFDMQKFLNMCVEKGGRRSRANLAGGIRLCQNALTQLEGAAPLARGPHDDFRVIEIREELACNDSFRRVPCGRCQERECGTP